MARKATTIRIDPGAEEGLAMLGRLLGRSHNQLVNEAIKEFVARRGAALERDLEATLGRLRAWRERDGDSEAAIAKAAEAEMSVEHDPAEGTVPSGKGPLQARLQNLLDA